MATSDEIQYTRISWRRCISRCHNTKDPDYHRYGAKGIVVCERWRGSFMAFMEDMGPRPQGLTLDRINSNGNYELYGPDGKLQCRWATSKTQNRHAQNLITYKGETLPLGEWAKRLQINQTTLTMRLKRLSIEEAFETPIQR